MTRIVTVGAAQLGPIQRADSRASVVKRMLDLLREADGHGCDLVVFPELSLTTFFPRWWMEDQEEIDSFFEREMPSNETAPLFNEARERGIGFSLGFAELTEEGGRTRRFNTAILVDKTGKQVGKYRKIHLPGHAEHEPWRPFQHLERRYFEESPEGFGAHRAFGGVVGMALCNDRRWPETYRVLGLQGVELVLIGYNTPLHYPPDPAQTALQAFHNHLVMQAGAYQNGTFVVGVAKGGNEEGVESLAQSAVIAPSGQIVAQAVTTGDELVVARCDLDLCRSYTHTLFDFTRYRRPEAYGLITERRGPVPPP